MILFNFSATFYACSPCLQGCNLALESVRVFAQTLDSVAGDLNCAPAAFTTARLEDVHAMQTIEYMQVCQLGLVIAECPSLACLSS